MIILLTISICMLLTAGYILLMLAYIKGWTQQKDFILPPVYAPHTKISVIIPARNESRNIGACLESILAQKYPHELYEIIVVDDHSEDNTVEVVHEYTDKNVRCISLADHLYIGQQVNAYKKAAIAAGISNSNGALIVTTDADCVVPNAWLMHIAACFEIENPSMIVAPVIYYSNHSILQLFQLIDFMSMQGITAAAHKLHLGNMSNGANLAFRKSAYEFIGGYEGMEHLASGDDYLLMTKINKFYPGSISYLKSPNAIVSTTPQYSWYSFMQQRIRWASKSGKYKDIRLTLILILVYLFNASFLVLTVGGFFNSALWYIAGLMLIVKILAEYVFIILVARFFKREWVLMYFPFLQPLHILYIIVAGFLGFAGGYKWKGRNVK